jgi:nucleoside-diphosphate-sugar epimerase
MSGRLLLLGAGYCARALAAELLGEGWEVHGTATREAGLAELDSLGIRPWRFGPEHSLPAAAWAGVSHALSSIPPSEAGDPALEHLQEQAPALSWLGYVSSTGVYGDHEGAWVDEESELRPAGSARAQRRQAAEAGWRALAQPWQVFRASGIYGPGRGPLARVLAGRARRLDAPHLFSRIHRDDICAAIRASLERPRPGGIYNLCDREPATSAEVTAYACELLGRDVPPLEPFALERLPASVASFYRDRRRVRSLYLEHELGLSLRYPSYREGLAADATLLQELPGP